MIAAAIIAPLAWLFLAYGQDGSVRAFANQDNAGGLTTGDFVRPALCLAAAGLLLGLIATLRFSPLGAALAGTAYTACYLALLLKPNAVLHLFPKTLTLAGRDADPTTPLRTGATLLLGALLLVSVASIGRWRRWPVPDAGAPEKTGDDRLVLPDDRPLGADGLGLAPARHASHERTREPAWTPGASGAGPSSWPTNRPV